MSATEERYWSKVDRNGPVHPALGTRCWPWRGLVDRDGYGRLKVARRMVLAHRLGWRLTRGEIPEGKTIDHLCRNRGCQNPDHMEPVTNRVNVLRGVGHSAVNALKTHCVNGHPFDERNTHVRKEGHRECRACMRDRERARYRRLRGQSSETPMDAIVRGPARPSSDNCLSDGAREL